MVLCISVFRVSSHYCMIYWRSYDIILGIGLNPYDKRRKGKREESEGIPISS